MIGTIIFGSEDVGNLVVNCQESVQIIGNSDCQFTSLLSGVSSQATGRGADITIKTDGLLVQGKASVIAQTSGKG